MEHVNNDLHCITFSFYRAHKNIHCHNFVRISRSISKERKDIPIKMLLKYSSSTNQPNWHWYLFISWHITHYISECTVINTWVNAINSSQLHLSISDDIPIWLSVKCATRTVKVKLFKLSILVSNTSLWISKFSDEYFVLLTRIVCGSQSTICQWCDYWIWKDGSSHVSDRLMYISKHF